MKQNILSLGHRATKKGHIELLNTGGGFEM